MMLLLMRNGGNDQTLWFAMSFYDLQVVAPEAGVWSWAFELNDNIYKLEAVRGGVVSIAANPDSSTDDLIGMAPPRDRFRLLGPCLQSSGGLRCPSNREVGGEIDMNSNRVIWKVPITLPSLIR
jgi:hypothetical protein